MMAARMQALAAHLAVAAPSRIVTRSYADFSGREKADLRSGIFTIISAGEKSFVDEVYEPGDYGSHDILITGQIQLDEGSTGEETEDAEFGLIADLKAAVAGPLPSELLGLTLHSWRQSGQIEAPYGWIAAQLGIAIENSRFD